MKRLLLYVIAILFLGASVRSILIDKHEAEVKLACEQALQIRSETRRSPHAPDLSGRSLIQVNEERQTCSARSYDK